ncbi:type II toxin-antitoxin system VapC family toxin [Acidiphilium sp. AL]|uniref:Ribonuclease VapC n=1 Tax=Acidiphilium iwatense TaxID=768198 RepID=A0ABS9DTI5_9PROT|nr:MULTISPECIES: type II toxin-antitoxin system VapC family toxin [Acidiphilium]MCF3945085.1 type II toxin-antitoxin system VapC family toxin [Acidiphilium iwatense]MCU4160570.1 type II toxin-antitoxin system VapC family toxin [Acidiphilium sp. AL]
MRVFTDASALVAILAKEPAAIALADCLDAASSRLCSALSAWETVAALCRSHALPIDITRARVDLFLENLGFGFVPIAEREFALATEAYARFGKGRHQAALNMGDCFAYACARSNDAKLLFLGDDFARTDITPALV